MGLQRSIDALRLTDSASAPSRLTELLSARSPGLLVRYVDGTLGATGALSIRGMRSIFFPNDPIMEVDGMLFEPAMNTPFAQSQWASFLDMISPEEIASVEVVNGFAGSTARGSAISNGLLRVNTLAPVAGPVTLRLYTAGATHFDPRSYEPVWFAKAVGSNTQCTVLAEAAGNCNIDRVFTRNAFDDASATALGTGIGGRIGASLTGGSDRLAYRASVGVSHESGIFQLPDVNRANLIANDLPVTDELEHASFLESYHGRLSATAKLNSSLEARVSAGLFTQASRVPDGPGIYRWQWRATADTSADYLWERAFVGATPDVVPSMGPSFTMQDGTDRTMRRGWVTSQLNWDGGAGLTGWLRGGVGWDQIRDTSSLVFLGVSQQMVTEVTEVQADTSNHRMLNFDVGVAKTGEIRPGITATGSISLQGRWRKIRLDLYEAQIEDGVPFFSSVVARIPTSSTGVVASGSLLLPRGFSVAGVLRLDRFAMRGVQGSSDVAGSAEARWSLTTDTTRSNIEVLANYGTVSQPVGSEMEIGARGRAFRGRLNIEAVRYRQELTDGLGNRFGGPPVFGKYDHTNEGWEVQLSAVPVATNSVTWRIDAHGSTNESRAYATVRTDTIIAWTGFETGPRPSPVGYPLTVLGGRREFVFNDANGDGLLTAAEFTPPPLLLDRPALPPTAVAAGTEVLFASGVVRAGALVEHMRGAARAWMPRRAESELENNRAANDGTLTLDEQALLVSPYVILRNTDFTRLRELWVSAELGTRIASLLRAEGITLTLTARNVVTWTDFPGDDPEAGGLGIVNPRYFSLRMGLRW